ncbi:unnamed protein product [Chondrus crispus]|uniref:Uncharacterized protein n=1 Tax=Chondrus crispus TaxID=2769 RepID=R7QI38_CHOCR|nr:unnamed protein product [Chondrus crispus]CDF37423.1 unnamed protein product [Chondrus crispus]|eukprot:XP_005717242.1 unnamed protein product [Chondrus crispus]
MKVQQEVKTRELYAESVVILRTVKRGACSTVRLKQFTAQYVLSRG